MRRLLRWWSSTRKGRSFGWTAFPSNSSKRSVAATIIKSRYFRIQHTGFSVKHSRLRQESRCSTLPMLDMSVSMLPPASSRCSIESDATGAMSASVILFRAISSTRRVREKTLKVGACSRRDVLVRCPRKLSSSSRLQERKPESTVIMFSASSRLIKLGRF